jgi:uncharacterized membrane protein YjjB (DUF3815 family)
MKRNKGISLIVLVITIIVIIILAGAVILSLANNNPITQATKATYLSDIKNFETELNLFKIKQFSDKMGAYIPTLLQADDISVTYAGNIDTSKTIYDIIPSLGRNTKYIGQFQVVDGNLIFQGSDVNKQNWSNEAGIEVVVLGEPKITILAPTETFVKQGTDIVYTLKFSSNAPLISIDLTNKVEVVNESNVTLPVQPTIIVGAVSGTSSDAIRQTNITIKTDNMLNGTYKLKIKALAVTNSESVSNTQDIISPIGFEVQDILPPVNPTMSANPTSWTNGDVTVTITYSADSVIKEYSFDGLTWNSYTVPVVVTVNNTTVYARGFDIARNESGTATLTVSNIDKIAPTVTAINGGVTTSSVTVNAAASDTGGSSLNTLSYQYSNDDGVTWTAASSAVNYTFTGLTAGTYNCRVKVSDNAGNVAISAAVVITTTSVGTVSIDSTPTSWTNGDVTVTITYPAEIVTKEYSLDGTTWSTYTAAVVVSANGTVYARGFDAGNNQTAQATMTIANIDKTLPVVTATNGGVTTSSITVNAVANDTGGSLLNVSSYQYSNDDGVTWTAASSAVNYTFTGLTAGTYNCRVKVSDNAGNIAISNTVAITTTSVGTVSMSATPTSWTNGNVTVTITYPTEIVTKEYSLDGTTWNTYTAAVVFSANGTVYARGFDAGNNQTAQATMTVANIDKTLPVVTATNGGATTSSVTVNAVASDTGGSLLNASSYQYSKDNGATWTAASLAVNYTFTGLTAGTYNCRVKVSDNAGNIAISNTVAITTTSVGTVSMSATPTSWTNGNVTVTITYPAEIVTKEYSTNGTTWSTYTAAIVVSANGTVYARGYDAGNNQTAQATITITNIEKIAPTVVFGTNGATNIATASTTVTVSDTGGSNINTSTLQYIWDTQNVTTPSSGWTVFTNGTTLTKTASSGTYYLWIKGSDNAGNTVVTKTNAFTFAVDYNASKGVNKPRLAAGMTPIKWDASGNVIATTEADTAWYDYTTKQWANARTADGSMWVWIPRYEYKIPTPHTSTPQTILINFKQNVDTTATSGYRVHPAFTFGGIQLTGIWIAKFEAGGTTTAVDVKPGVISIRNVSLSDIYTACRGMETNSRYGWGTTGVGFDTHFIKNTEWGLAAYIANSVYGKNSQLAVNTNSSYYTGGGSGTSYVSNIAQSTTGTIYGVYDMAGGNWEFVAAYPNNGNSNLTANASALYNAPAQYKDVYTASPDTDASNYANAATMYGDAIYETSASYSAETAWYGGYSYMIYGSQIAFVRGGVYAAPTLSSQFSTNVYAGVASGMHGFRPVIAVATGL